MDQTGTPPEAMGEEPVEEPAAPPPVSDDGSSAQAGPPPGLPQPDTEPGQTSATLSLSESAKLFSPQSLLDSIQEQFLGAKTPEQQQKEQADFAQAERSAAAARQAFESSQAAQKAENQKRVQETIQLKSEALQLGRYDAGSVVLAQTTAGDLSEQTVIHSAIQAAQERRQREQRARQLMAQQKAVRKGPQPEGGEAKSSMMDQMGSSNEAPPSQDQDALQRQAEQAIGE